MRGRTKITLVAVCGLLSAGLVVGQPGGFQPPFGGGGFGGFGGNDPYSLLKRQNVQKELQLTQDQLKKVDEAVEKAIKGALDAKQAQRLDQIVLQQKGVDAYKDPAIQSKLKLSKAQKEDITVLFSDYEKEVEKARKEGKGGKGGFGGGGKTAELRKELQERVQSVLTSEQKTMWEGMVGEPFKMFEFGGGKGGPGGGKKPKDDA